MPFYDYRCSSCGIVFEEFQRSMVSSDAESAPACERCGSEATERRVTRVAVLKRVGPGIGQAAYPTSWSATNNGDADTLRYWRQRVEQEKSQEASDPGLTQERLLSAEHHYEEIAERIAPVAPLKAEKTPTANSSEGHGHSPGPGGHTHGPAGHTH